MREQDWRRLPSSRHNPFLDSEAVGEAYLFEVQHNLVNSELRVLIGLGEQSDQRDRYDVGMYIFRGLSEYGWMSRDWQTFEPPHWWISMESGFTTLDDGPRMILPSIPNWPAVQSSAVSPQQSGYRYRFYLDPNSQFVVQFISAAYVIGSQNLIGLAADARPTLDQSTEWYAACHWPG
jgi:hypothetical protein